MPMNSLTDAFKIPDTQSEHDDRHLAIQRVGVKHVRYPLKLVVAGAEQATAASWDLDVALPADQKGTHMSRFVAWLDQLSGTLDLARLRSAFDDMLDRLNAQEGRVEATFTFFIRKRAPVSGLASLLDYQGRWIAERRSGVNSVWAEVAVPVKSLCPCSKEISDYGAHNQRSCVTLRVELKAPVEWHELVRFAEDNASCELVAAPQARRREVGHRAGLREPEVRRRPGARRRPRRLARRAHRPLLDRRREFRVDPQPLRLRPHRTVRSAPGPPGTADSPPTGPRPCSRAAEPPAFGCFAGLA